MLKSWYITPRIINFLTAKTKCFRWKPSLMPNISLWAVWVTRMRLLHALHQLVLRDNLLRKILRYQINMTGERNIHNVFNRWEASELKPTVQLLMPSPLSVWSKTEFACKLTKQRAFPFRKFLIVILIHSAVMVDPLTESSTGAERRDSSSTNV